MSLAPNLGESQKTVYKYFLLSFLTWGRGRRYLDLPSGCMPMDYTTSLIFYMAYILYHKITPSTELRNLICKTFTLRTCEFTLNKSDLKYIGQCNDSKFSVCVENNRHNVAMYVFLDSVNHNLGIMFISLFPSLSYIANHL